MDYRLVHVRINSGNNVYTSCENLVNIGPVTPEFKRAEFENSAATRQEFDDCLSFGTLTF